jgi:hypothetical protein
VKWYQARLVEGARKQTMIVALARKLLVALWRLATAGEVPQGVRYASGSLIGVVERDHRVRHPTDGVS